MTGLKNKRRAWRSKIIAVDGQTKTDLIAFEYVGLSTVRVRIGYNGGRTVRVARNFGHWGHNALRRDKDKSKKVS